MSKEADMGDGFVMNKEKGIMKDGKVVFTQEQLDDLKLARRMILDMYTVTNGTVDYIAQGRVYKELNDHGIKH